MIVAYLKISMLLRAAKEALSAASKAWNEALPTLDRKLALYERALQDWHAGEGPLQTAQAELLALVSIFIIFFEPVDPR